MSSCVGFKSKLVLKCQEILALIVFELSLNIMYQLPSAVVYIMKKTKQKEIINMRLCSQLAVNVKPLN